MERGTWQPIVHGVAKNQVYIQGLFIFQNANAGNSMVLMKIYYIDLHIVFFIVKGNII